MYGDGGEMRHVLARQNYLLGITFVPCYRCPLEYEYPSPPSSHVRRIPPRQLVGMSLSSPRRHVPVLSSR
jgi:hypothetical protein